MRRRHVIRFFPEGKDNPAVQRPFRMPWLPELKSVRHNVTFLHYMQNRSVQAPILLFIYIFRRSTVLWN